MSDFRYRVKGNLKIMIVSDALLIMNSFAGMCVHLRRLDR
jgi:hypothetical protein